MMSAFECRIDAGVATFVIDNPPQNRLSFAVIRGFAEAVQKVHGHPDVRVVVVRAAGENFCFGGDISNWLDLEPAQMGENTGRALSIFNAFEQLPVPVITAVQGRCTGGGFELVLRSDIIVAAEGAQFGHSEQTLGVVTLLGGIQRVAERAGRARATRWAYTSELVPAAEMLAAGVITEVVPPGDLLKAAQAWAVRLGRGPTRAHAGHKQMLRAWSDGGIEAADKLLPALTTTLMQTEDARRGIASAIDALSRGVDRPDLDFHGR
jgi:enoyl-CoA hydratase/carnithine racemase